MSEYLQQAREFLLSISANLDAILAARTSLQTSHFRSLRLYEVSLQETSEKVNALHFEGKPEGEGDPIFDIRSRLDYLQTIQQDISRVRSLISVFDNWILHEQTQAAFPAPLEGEGGLVAELEHEAYGRLKKHPETQLVESIGEFLRQGHGLEGITELTFPAGIRQGYQFSRGHDR